MKGGEGPRVKKKIHDKHVWSFYRRREGDDKGEVKAKRERTTSRSFSLSLALFIWSLHAQHSHSFEKNTHIYSKSLSLSGNVVIDTRKIAVLVSVATRNCYTSLFLINCLSLALFLSLSILVYNAGLKRRLCWITTNFFLFVLFSTFCFC